MENSSPAMVYVVDDDEVVRDSLRALLEVRKYRVREFDSGEYFLSENPAMDNCCLILDVHMPGMTGLELLRTLRSRQVKVPTILITGRRDSAINAQAEELGARCLLDKPVSHALLFGAIEQALSGH